MKFRSKPVEIEAVRLEAPMKVDPSGWYLDEWDAKRLWTFTDESDRWHWHIETANGPVQGEVGDWLIREPSGVGCYPCKPDVFERKYEPL